MLKYFNKEKNMQLDPQVASQMLSNIFDACDIEQNSVPLEVLTSYSNYRKERFLFQKFVLGFLLIAKVRLIFARCNYIVYLLPFIL